MSHAQASEIARLLAIACMLEDCHFFKSLGGLLISHVGSNGSAQSISKIVKMAFIFETRSRKKQIEDLYLNLLIRLAAPSYEVRCRRQTTGENTVLHITMKLREQYR